jgi:hypothetical protein
MRNRTPSKGQRAKGIGHSLVISILSLLALPSAALCDIQSFIPRIIDYNGELDIYMLRQTNDNSSAGTRTSTADNSVMEQLKLSLAGYVYHPAFITFLATGSVGLLQDQFTNNGVSSPWTNSSDNEYDVTVHVLPEKPYNLDLLTSRSESFAGAGLLGNIRPVVYLNSATFTYHEIPIGFSANYTDTKTITSSTTDSGVLNLTASHGIQHSYTTVGYTHSNTSSNTGTDYSQNYYFLTHQLQFDWFVLRSQLKYDDYNQINPLDTVTGSDETWLEDLHMKLPWRFESDVSYNRTFNISQSEETPAVSSGSVQSPQKQFNSDDVLIGNLTHRLGDSLFTSYTYNDTTTSSSGGRSDSESNALGVTYTKKIPWGVLTTGVSGNIQTSNNVGSITTLNEVHTAKADGIDSFTLQPGLIDPSTIVVYVVAPVTGFKYLLVNNQNYVIEPIGNTFKITVLPFLLNPVVGFTPNSDINFVYTFNVSYSSVQGTFGLNTTTTGYNAGLALFNNFLNPYFNHIQSSQRVVSGFFPGELSSYSTDVTGITVQKAPFRFSTEYQKYDSTINSNRVWKSRFDFWQNLSQSFSVAAGLSYDTSHFLQSESSIGITAPYTDIMRGASVSVHKIFDTNLTISGTGSYGNTTGHTVSNTYSFNGLLSWRMGKMFVDAQTTYQHVDTLASNTRQSIGSTLCLIKIRRILF